VSKSAAKPVRLVIMGACGKMGLRLIALASETPGLEISAAVERAGNPSLGKDAGEAAGVGSLGVAIRDNVAEALAAGDVVIDFSAPGSTLALIPRAVERQRPLVIGTTGLPPDALGTMRQAAGKIPIVFAPNASLGMNVMFKIVADVARVGRGG
jgi:4-hydroxy-tetrahydrodipicolinate reductase